MLGYSIPTATVFRDCGHCQTFFRGSCCLKAGELGMYPEGCFLDSQTGRINLVGKMNPPPADPPQESNQTPNASFHYSTVD